MQHITSPFSLAELHTFATCSNPSGERLAKAVVDIRVGDVVIGGGMHADEEEMFLNLERNQEDLWGINLYPDFFGTDRWIEFDSMINLRPSAGNKTRGIENPEIRKKIIIIVSSLVLS